MVYFKNLIIRIIAKFNKDFMFKRIEKSIGFKLDDWQRNYILGDADYIVKGQRGNGKTATILIKELLDYKAKPLVVYRQRGAICNYDAMMNLYKNDPDVMVMRTDWMCHNLYAMYNMLKQSGLKLRKIEFK